MSISTMVITFAAEPLPDDPYWLTINPDTLDDRATMADVAEIVDELYKIDPCHPSALTIARETGANPPPVEPTPEDLLAAFGNKIDLAECLIKASGDYTTTVTVVRSHPDLPYKAVLDVGKVTRTVKVEEEKVLTISVKNGSSILLPFPVIADLRASWLGTVFGSRGAVTPPTLKARHNTIYWQATVTGTLRVSYRTTYDVLTIEVPGLLAFPADKVGAPQDSRLLIFYHYQSYGETINPPARDENFSENLADICGWRSSSVAWGEDDQPLPEPPAPKDPCLWNPENWNSSYDLHYLADPRYYEDTCCKPPPFPLPKCGTWVAGHKPGKDLDQATKDKYIAGHNGPVQFIGIGNPGPEGCGEIIHEIDDRKRNCCDEIPPLEADPANPAEISSYARVKMCVTGGDTLLTWTAGGGLYFDGGLGRVTTHLRCLFVNAPADFCGHSVIEVNDNCSELDMDLYKPNYVPFSLTRPAEQEMTFGSTLVYVEYGTPPYKLVTEGAHTHFANGTQEIILSTAGFVQVFVDKEQICGGDFAINGMDSCGESASVLIPLAEVPTGLTCVRFISDFNGLIDWCDGPRLKTPPTLYEYNGISPLVFSHNSPACDPDYCGVALPTGIFFITFASTPRLISIGPTFYIGNLCLQNIWVSNLLNYTSVPDPCNACE
jgi:hypothetical protein